MRPRWTEEEVETLRKWYRSHRSASWGGWAKRLPGRSPAAIQRKAVELGLTKRKRSGSRPWSDEDSAVVLRAVLELSRRLDRTPMGVIMRATYLVRDAKSIMSARGRDGQQGEA